MSMNVPGQSQPEYLEPGSGPADSGEPPRSSRGRRTVLVAAAAVAVVAAVGVGAYGVVQLMSGGSSPATAVPADAVGYVSIDLDPSASQKIEAFKILRKFPAIKKQLGSRDDLRKAVFDEIQKSGDCKGLDYAHDVEPWIGDRIALAAVPDSKQGAVPLMVLQVTDQAKAKAGARKLEACGGPAADQEPEARGHRVRRRLHAGRGDPGRGRRDGQGRRGLDARGLPGVHRGVGADGRPRHRDDVRVQGRARRDDEGLRAQHRFRARSPPRSRTSRALPASCASPTARWRPSSRPRACPPAWAASAPRAGPTSAPCPARRPRRCRSRSGTAGSRTTSTSSTA